MSLMARAIEQPHSALPCLLVKLLQRDYWVGVRVFLGLGLGLGL